VLKPVPDPHGAAAGRVRMKVVCGQCHSAGWVDGYFVEFDKVVEDYNQLWEPAGGLLKQPYAEGSAETDNPIDEPPEIYHYLIWHHPRRGWRMGQP
jgi:hydroxylamine dehydrogenase